MSGEKTRIRSSGELYAYLAKQRCDADVLFDPGDAYEYYDNVSVSKNEYGQIIVHHEPQDDQGDDDGL